MSDYKTPIDKLITNEQAAELNACFKQTQNSFGVEKSSNLSCSSWYSLEELEGYISYVKQQALEHKVNVDGIRFYFGVYPESTKDKSKIGQNTLFMCPTTPSSENCSKDVTKIAAMNYGDGGNPPQNDYGE